MNQRISPKEVTADELKKGDRLWFKYQVDGQDYITDIWEVGGRIKVQCDNKSSCREYDPGALVQIYFRRKKKRK